MIKKRVISLILATVLLVSAYGCRSRGNPSEDSSQPTHTIPQETESEPGIPTPPPPIVTVPLDSALVAFANESLLLDGEVVRTKEELAAAPEGESVTLPVELGVQLRSITLNGWIGFKEAIDTFGYRINGGEPTFGLFETYTEEAVREEGGQYARRYSITAPLFSLLAGTHTVEFLARLADGSIQIISPAVTLLYEGLETDLSIPYHSAVTALNGKGPNGTSGYEGRGGNTDQGVDVIDVSLDGITMNADCRLIVNGWLALEGGVECYVWTPDGYTWYTATDGYADGEPAEGHFESLGYENAARNALMKGLELDLSPIGGQIAWITLGAIPADAPGKVVPFLTVTGLDIPIAPTDIPYSFISDVGSNPAGTDLMSSDLKSFFDISYGAGEPRQVELMDQTPTYVYQGIHSLQAMMDGTYAITATVQSMGNSSFLFARGVKQMVSVDTTVPIPLHNFYETDGLRLCGGAGIYARLDSGKLTLVIKGLDPSAPYRVRNYSYELAAEGNQLTLADDGVTVYCYVDGVLMATIRTEGSVEYPEHFDVVQPYARFAESATVTLSDGRTDIIHETLIASTCASQVGIAIRGGHVFFSRISVIPYSDFISKQG